MFKKIVCSILLGVFILGIVAFSYFLVRFNNFFFVTPTSYARFDYDEIKLPFIYGKTKYGDYIEEHSSILIPLNISDTEKRLFIQFDTGSPYSYLHENTIKDTAIAIFAYDEIERDQVALADNISIPFESGNVQVNGLRISKGYGRKISELSEKGRNSIGTLGMDFFGTKTLEIDFKNQIITVHKMRPEYPKVHFKSFDYKGRRLMFPVRVKNKKYTYFYDSGSSGFGLITTKQRFNRHRYKAAKVDTFSASRHGGSLPLVHTQTEDVLNISDISLPLSSVSYVDMYASVQFLISPFTKIGGWLGNKPFLNTKLVIDLNTEEFGVIKLKLEP